MVKIFVVVIGSFELPINREFIRWRKQLLTKYAIPHLFVFDDDIPNDYILDSNDIRIPKQLPPYPVTNTLNSRPEAINPHMVLKFLKAFHKLNLSDYDYVVRLNLSTYVNFQELNQYLETSPRNLFCAGHTLTHVLPDWSYNTIQPQTLISGTCMIFSKDICSIFQSIPFEAPVLYEHNDDVVLSYIVRSLGIPFYHLPMIFLETDCMATLEQLQSHFLFRIKHCTDRLKDYYHWKFLMSYFDRLTI